MTHHSFASFARDQRGTTVVEFAVVAVPLCMLIFGGIDLAYQAYATSLVQGTTNAAARMATMEGATAAKVQTYVNAQLASLAPSSSIEITAKNFLTYNKIGAPEKLTTDKDGDGVYDKADGDCFIDDNRNKIYDTASQGATGLGTAEDVVRYQVKVTYNRLSPLPYLAGMGRTVTITRETLMRNEPYAGIVDPPTECGV